MLTLCKCMVLGATFLAGGAIAAHADPASTNAAGTVTNGASGSQSQGRGLAALPSSNATPVPNSVTQPQTPAGAFGSSGAQSNKGSFYSKRGFGPAPN
jgi:type IV secretory pathway TrbL component